MASSFTQQDIDNVNQALKDLGNGKRRVSVTWSDSGGTRTVEYDKTKVEDLIALRDMMIGEFNANQPKPKSRSMLTRSRKGL